MITVYGMPLKEFNTMISSVGEIPFNYTYQIREDAITLKHDLTTSDFVISFGDWAKLSFSSMKNDKRCGFKQSKTFQNIFFIIRRKQILTRLLLIKDTKMSQKEIDSFKWMLKFEKNFHQIRHLTLSKIHSGYPEIIDVKDEDLEDDSIYMILKKQLERVTREPT